MSRPPTHLTRRRFIARSAALATTVAATPLAPLLRAGAAQPSSDFHSDWDVCPDRVWLGPEYWANPLQDWRIANGRIECLNAAADRNVHVLTRYLGESTGNLAMTVRVGRLDAGVLGGGKGTAGFRIGVQGSLHDYRHSLIYGTGLDAGIGGDGALFIGDVRRPMPGAATLDAAELRLTAEPTGDTYTVTLRAHDAGGQELGAVSKRNVPSSQLVGNLAVACNAGGENSGLGRFWFADLKISGSKVETDAERAFGPILFSHYTLSRGVLKLTAQMPPLGEADSQVIRLDVRKGSKWSTIGEGRVHADARTATFRIPNWDDKRELRYRLAYTLQFKNGRSEEHFWTGSVRRDPTEKPVLTVGAVCCNIHQAFPNAAYVANMARLDPDLLAFTGDQFYESSGGYRIIRTPVDKAMIDYLRKWYMHGWTWRELMRDRPSLSLPDDHDVFQGNLWGEAGDGRKTTQEAGGYDMPPEWVNVVHRTQTSHHPDPYDPAPGRRGSIQYYGPLTYGRVSFAVLADRQYKSGPEG
jgi:alkaline phosphatase D